MAAKAAVAPASHLRVVDAVADPSPAIRSYADLGARIVGLRVSHPGAGAAKPIESASPVAYHATVELSPGAPPHGLRPDDADIVVWDGAEGIPIGWLATRLAAGGVLVIPATLAERATACGLVVGAATVPGVVLARDPRPNQPVPAALAALDRTMSVDRPAVLRALRARPFFGARSSSDGTAAEVAIQTERLRSELSRQLRAGRVDARRLPWPSRTAPLPDAAAGCDVLAVMPHPDDESIYLGGTMRALVAAGRRVKLVVATDGGAGRRASTDAAADLGAVRAAELVRASAMLGVEGLQSLGWPDTGKYRDADRCVPATAADAIVSWGGETALQRIVGLIREHRPRTLLGLDPLVDPNLSLHGHHLGLGVLLAVAFHLAADPGYILADGRPGHPAWACDEHRVATAPWLPGDCDALAIDRSAKRAAIAAYTSQAYSTRRMLAALDDAEQDCTEATRRVQARGTPAWLLAVATPRRPAPIDWPTRAAAVTAAPRDRKAIVDVLERQTSARPPDPATTRSLAALGRPDSVAVVTGQQVGWLGGPAYSLTKALGAVALARQLGEQGLDAVPVFWMATHDHDALEAATAPCLDGPAIRLPRSTGGEPVGGQALPTELHAALRTWARRLPAGDADRAHALAARHYVPGRSYAEAFASLLGELTRGTGLLILDPDDPALARLARRVYERELLGSAPAAGPLREPPPGSATVIPVDRDVTQVFYIDDDGRRQRLRRVSDGVTWPGGSLSRDALSSQLRHAPERFSPAALLRPVVQDLLLPAIATLAGPTERRYLAQMQPLYAWAAVVASAVVQRPSVRPLGLADVAALRAAGGVQSLRTEPRPSVQLGRAGLSRRAASWLEAVVRLKHAAWRHRAAARRRDARVHIDELRAGLANLRREAPEALADLRSLRSFAVHERALTGLLAEPTPTPRTLTRVARRLHQVQRGVLRDGRRQAAAAVRAWSRCEGSPERRMTTAEFAVRFGPEGPAALLAALLRSPESFGGGVVDLYGGQR